MPTVSTITAAQLLEPPYRGRRCELIEGEIHMMSPAGWRHGDVVGILHALLGSHILQHRMGRIFGAETGFLLSRSPDTVRAPDLAFIMNENLPDKVPEDAYWPGAPDLAVEVLSPDDHSPYVQEKIHIWLSSGVKEVWIVDPKSQSVAIHRSSTDISKFSKGDTLRGNDLLLPNFSCSVAELFRNV